MVSKKHRIFALWMILVLLFSVGCVAPATEESAVADTVVESVEQDESSADLPEKVEPNQQPETIISATPPEQSDEPKEEAPQEETPQEQPSEEEEQPEEEEPKVETVEYKQENKFVILDYNIRCADDGPGKLISERAARFKKLVEKYQPDIMGLQEATPKWIDFLGNNLAGATYSMYYRYRADDSKEAQPIMWNHNKLEVMDKGYFWLSDTPETPSKGWGSSHYRGCTWMKFKVKATGEVFLFMNTHLTGNDTPAGNSANLIINRARKMGGFDRYAVFLTGDFNFSPESKGYMVMTAGFCDVNDLLGFNSAYTNNGYNEREDHHKDNWIKDYVMCSEDHVVPLSYAVLNEKIDDGWISDHRGLLVEAAIY